MATEKLAKIRRAVRQTEFRIRLNRLLKKLPWIISISAVLIASVITIRKWVPNAMSHRTSVILWVAMGCIALGSVLVLWIQKLKVHEGTLQLDRFHDLKGRLTNALAFETQTNSEWAMLAVEDAMQFVSALHPQKAVPIRFPRAIWGALLVWSIPVVLSRIELQKDVPVVVPVAKSMDALILTPDFVDFFREAARELEARTQTPEMKAALDKFHQLMEDIANRRIDRNEAFRRLEEIERSLNQESKNSLAAAKEGLRETAEELKKSDLSKPLSRALEKSDLNQAEEELKKLAKDLRKKKVDKAELERLRKALKSASEKRKEALEALEQKRAELEQQLLKKKNSSNQDAGTDEQEEKLLKKKERELERLQRDIEQRRQAGRQLDRLDRELAKAAEDLLRDLGLSADDLEQAAEDIHRMQEEALTEEEKEELRQRLEELRELIRQQGQSGKKRIARMMRFGKRARGDGDPQSGSGNGGEEEQGSGEEEGEESSKEGANKKGKSTSGQGNQTWVLGKNGKKILMVTSGGSSSEKGNGQQGSEPSNGKEAGTGHDANMRGKETGLQSKTQDVQAAGLDTSQGPSNSQVIYGAAQKGFKGSGYKKVFREYKTVAESQLDRENVPDGYRFYVQRYFQLIRPRE